MKNSIFIYPFILITNDILESIDRQLALTGERGLHYHVNKPITTHYSQYIIDTTIQELPSQSEDSQFSSISKAFADVASEPNPKLYVEKIFDKVKNLIRDFKFDNPYVNDLLASHFGISDKSEVDKFIKDNVSITHEIIIEDGIEFLRCDVKVKDTSYPIFSIDGSKYDDVSMYWFSSIRLCSFKFCYYYYLKYTNDLIENNYELNYLLGYQSNSIFIEGGGLVLNEHFKKSNAFEIDAYNIDKKENSKISEYVLPYEYITKNIIYMITYWSGYYVAINEIIGSFYGGTLSGSSKFPAEIGHLKAFHTLLRGSNAYDTESQPNAQFLIYKNFTKHHSYFNKIAVANDNIFPFVKNKDDLIKYKEYVQHVLELIIEKNKTINTLNETEKKIAVKIDYNSLKQEFHGNKPTNAEILNYIHNSFIDYHDYIKKLQNAGHDILSKTKPLTVWRLADIWIPQQSFNPDYKFNDIAGKSLYELKTGDLIPNYRLLSTSFVRNNPSMDMFWEHKKKNLKYCIFKIHINHCNGVICAGGYGHVFEQYEMTLHPSGALRVINVYDSLMRVFKFNYGKERLITATVIECDYICAPLERDNITIDNKLLSYQNPILQSEEAIAKYNKITNKHNEAVRDLTIYYDNLIGQKHMDNFPDDKDIAQYANNYKLFKGIDSVRYAQQGNEIMNQKNCINMLIKSAKYLDVDIKTFRYFQKSIAIHCRDFLENLPILWNAPGFMKHAIERQNETTEKITTELRELLDEYNGTNILGSGNNSISKLYFGDVRHPNEKNGNESYINSGTLKATTSDDPDAVVIGSDEYKSIRSEHLRRYGYDIKK